MNRETQEELGALFALDLLEDRDRMLFAGAIRDDSRLRALTDQLRETASLLACCESEKSPPPHLKQRLQDRIGRGPAAVDSRPHRLRMLPLLGWAAAACFAGLALWLGQLHYATREENKLLAQAQSLTDTALRSTQYQLEAESILHRHEMEAARRQLARLAAQDPALPALSDLQVTTCKSLLGHTPQAQAVAVWHPTRQTAILVADHLPALPMDRDYQLWIFDRQQPAPVDGGVFQVDPDSGQAKHLFQAAHPIDAATKFAVSIERKGGVAQAEGPLVLASD